METSRDVPPFFRIPSDLRQRIYTYLVAPQHKGDITTINYVLEWPFLDHPSSTTFTSHQLDHCKCPQQEADHREPSSPTGSHIYTRYICTGPEVQFRPKRRRQWVLLEPGPAFNILRPASAEELERRPDAGILRTNRQIYHESLPLLYRDRNFLLLTGICSRGRYQAYATSKWLACLSQLARSNITTLSLLIQPNEEDCQDSNSLPAFHALTYYLLDQVPRFRSLCLNIWASGIRLYPFSLLFRRAGMRVYFQGYDSELEIFSDAQSFLHGCRGPQEDEALKEAWLLECEKVDPERILQDSAELRP